MKLVFYTNFLNHHQVLVADELYRLLGKDYAFVATMQVDETLLKGGRDFSQAKSYCICAYNGGQEYERALQLAREAEVCVFGADALAFELERAKCGTGLSFEICERWLKKGLLNLASPRLLKWLINYHLHFRKAGFYRLCASAFCKEDDRMFGAYKGRSFKWGYFTEVPSEVSNGFILRQAQEPKFQKVSSSLNSKEPETQKPETNERPVRLMWCARFLTWKHPELPIELAARLKADGYNFHIDIYGGEGMNIAHEKVYPRKDLELRVESLGLKDYVTFQGNKPNAEILQAMREHDIFLFTSDKSEGWGAVANEAMANGCCLVGSDQIGAVPYLVRDGENGAIFRNCNIDDLYRKTKYLLDNPEQRKAMAAAGRKCMQELWSPRHAAESLLKLIEDLNNGREISIAEGPCSKA